MSIKVNVNGMEVEFNDYHLETSKAGRVILKIEGLGSFEYARWVWQAYTGQSIPKGYVIHHIDEDPTNNDYSNLQMMTWQEHLSLHHTGKEISEEQRRKMSEYGKTRVGELNPFFGKHHSDESIEKNRQAHLGNTYRRGKKQTDEARRKMSEAKKGKPSPRKGHSMSDEQKRKISESKKGQVPPNKGKKMSDEQKDKLRLAAKKQYSEEGRKKHSQIMKDYYLRK